MEFYLVGGAVRDGILGRTISDRDWVVVGSNPTEMKQAGYKQVGGDFPVFIHPRSGEEYALARTERKTGVSHTDFECYSGSEVTLEDDLKRRDLTINAIAKSVDGEIIDPFGGRFDIDRKLLRHVSPAFVEDPLRVYRIARFSAALPAFSIAEDTFELISGMSKEVHNLPGERIWGEWKKAAVGQEPWRFFDVIRAVGAVDPWFTGLNMSSISQLFRDRNLRGENAFSALGWVTGSPQVSLICDRIKSPRTVRSLSMAIANWGRVIGFYEESSASEIAAALSGIGNYRQGPLCEHTLALIEWITGTSLESLRDVANRARNIKLTENNLRGEAHGEALSRKRVEFIANHLGIAG